jgi:hypothetical protein
MAAGSLLHFEISQTKLLEGIPISFSAPASDQVESAEERAARTLPAQLIEALG